MTIKGHYVLTYRGQLVAVWSQSRAVRVMVWCALVLFVFLAMIELINRLVGADASSLGTLGILLVAMLSWPLMVVYGVSRLSPQQRDVTYLIDGERIVLRDAAGNEMSSPWHQITALDESRHGFLLRLGAGVRWMAKPGFAPDALAAFRDLARERLGGKARLLV